MTRQSWIQRRQFDSELQVSGVGVGVDSEERLKVVREGVSKVPEGEARDKEGVSKVPEGEARDKEGSVRCLRERPGTRTRIVMRVGRTVVSSRSLWTVGEWRWGQRGWFIERETAGG